MKVKPMTKAAEITSGEIGARVRSKGIDVAKAGRDRALRAAAAADQALTERGLAPQRLAEALAENADMAREELALLSERTRKRIAANAKRTRADLDRIAERARRSRAEVERRAAKAAAVAKTGRRRRWLWLLALGAIAAVVVIAVRGTRSSGRTAPVMSLNGTRESSEDEQSEPRDPFTDEIQQHHQ